MVIFHYILTRGVYRGWIYPYRVLCSFYDSILEHYREVSLLAAQAG